MVASFCRRTLNFAGNDEMITIKTRTKKVLAEYSSDDKIQHQSYDGDDEREVLIGNDASSDSSDGEADVKTKLPRNRRRRLNHYRKEQVKNDIAHIFFRFQHVLSKEHGAYFYFVTALRDAFFVVNQDDLNESLQVLRTKYNMTDKKIFQKMKHNFKWFLRRVRRLVPEPPVLEK